MIRTPPHAHPQGIDQDLKHACEAAIQSAVDLVSGALRAWTERVRVAFALDTEAPTPTRPRLDPAALPAEAQWASPAAAQAFVDAAGAGALERGAHDAAVRLRLYVEDERTVDVLLTHVQDRVVDDWMDFGMLISNTYGGALRGKTPSAPWVRERVARGCREDWQAEASGLPSSSSTVGR